MCVNGSGITVLYPSTDEYSEDVLPVAVDYHIKVGKDAKKKNYREILCIFLFYYSVVHLLFTISSSPESKPKRVAQNSFLV